MLDAVAGARSAVIAGRPPAVLEADLVESIAPVLPQEVLVEPGRQVIPGKHLVEGAVAVHPGVDVDPAGVRGGLPPLQVEVLGPLLEGASVPPHMLDHRAEPAVAPAGQAFGQGGRGVVPLELHAPGPAQVVAQQADLAPQLCGGVLPEPLERGERLGHEAADGHRHRRRPHMAPAQSHAVAGQLGDSKRVLVGLGGQASEEVELHPAPPLRVGRLHRRVEVVLGDELVDHLAHPPAARLGGEREPGAAGPLDLSRDAYRESVDAQAGQRHRDLAAAGVVDRGGDDLLDAAEVGGAQRGEGHLVVAGSAQALAHHGAHLLGGALAHRPGDHPGLAEAAAPGASPEDLDVEAIVYHLGERDQLALGIGPVGQVGHGALLDDGGHVGVARLDGREPPAVVDGPVLRRHVHPGHPGQGPEDPGTAPPAARGLPIA